jgi:acylphosphatase
MKRITITVSGLVQGVFFRYTTRNVARKLGLKGIVKNMPDGTVYIEAEGEDADLEQQIFNLISFYIA